MGFFDSLGGVLAAPFTGGLSLGASDKGRGFVNSLPVVGGLTSQLWGDPSQEAVQQAYREAQQQLAKQRAYQMDARMNAMNQSAMAFGPRNEMLGQMMGKQGPLMDLGPMLQNPMPQGMQSDIQKAAFGTAPPSVPPPMAQGAFSGVGQQNPYRRY